MSWLTTVRSTINSTCASRDLVEVVTDCNQGRFIEDSSRPTMVCYDCWYEAVSKCCLQPHICLSVHSNVLIQIYTLQCIVFIFLILFSTQHCTQQLNLLHRKGNGLTAMVSWHNFQCSLWKWQWKMAKHGKLWLYIFFHISDAVQIRVTGIAMP